jgi:dTDP-4-dehydrorhamnose reductase
LTGTNKDCQQREGTLVVTGASGLLGASVLLTARSFGREAVGITNRHLLLIPGTRVLSVDLTDASKTRDVISSLKPSSIIHCAALTDVDWCEDHQSEAEQVNSRASGVLAEIACRLSARFLYISTDSVFDGKRGSYSETDEPAPLNFYARSKLMGEQEVCRLNSSALIARVNIYGWNVQNKPSLAEWVLLQLAQGKDVPGFTDVFFNPILVNELAELLLTMVDCDLTGIYHAVGSERISKYEFARRVATTFGFDGAQVKPATLTRARLRAPRPLDVSLSTAKLQEALGRTIPDVGSGLQRFRALRESGYPKEIKSYLTGVGR